MGTFSFCSCVEATEMSLCGLRVENGKVQYYNNFNGQTRLKQVSVGDMIALSAPQQGKGIARKKV